MTIVILLLIIIIIQLRLINNTIAITVDAWGQEGGECAQILVESNPLKPSVEQVSRLGPISLLGLSLLKLFDSSFPGNSLWA